MLATLVTALKNYKLQVCDLRMGKDFQRMIVRQWVVQFKVFDQCMSLVCHVHPPAQAIVHSPQHVWHCGNGCLGVRNVRMEMQSVKWDSSDATPENCVGFFRVLDHSGMKYPKLIVYCLPVQSDEHFKLCERLKANIA